VGVLDADIYGQRSMICWACRMAKKAKVQKSKSTFSNLSPRFEKRILLAYLANDKTHDRGVAQWSQVFLCSCCKHTLLGEWTILMWILRGHRLITKLDPLAQKVP